MGVELGVRVTEPVAPAIRTDGVAVFYACFATIYTIILVGAMAFLYRKREMPMLKIRGLHLTLAAVIFMHMWWIAVQFGYMYAPLFAAGVEYWIMSAWLPFGIALFHASNSRFLYVAEMQKRFVRTDNGDLHRVHRSKKKTLKEKYETLDYTTKMLAVVGVGMFFQFFVALIAFCVSRKFHPSFGIPGTEVTGTPDEQAMAARKGWEWVPSVFWQFFWAWAVAPYVLWKSRNLHDTLGWRLQTIGCCLASLHATPMWLIALYVPEMGVINQYWLPPQWICFSVMLIEVFAIFLPCWEVLKHQTLRQETLDSIARWENRNKLNNAGGSIDTGVSSYVSWKPRKSRKKAASVSTSSGSSILTMDALEHTLDKNPEPLQQFSALKDFSGENIAFLRRVAEWKVKHYGIKMSDGRKIADKTTTSEVDVRDSFMDALRIYIDFISNRGADFQINLASADFKKLAAVFEHAARVVYGDEKTPDPALPFETADWRIGAPKGFSELQSNSSKTNVATAPPDTAKTAEAMEEVRYWGEIPEEYSEKTFDDAETHIKYLVLTNTWPKYVKARKSMDAIELAEMSGNSA